MTQFGQGRTTDEKILYAYFSSFAEMKCDSLEEITHWTKINTNGEKILSQELKLPEKTGL